MSSSNIIDRGSSEMSLSRFAGLVNTALIQGGIPQSSLEVRVSHMKRYRITQLTRTQTLISSPDDSYEELQRNGDDLNCALQQDSKPPPSLAKPRAASSHTEQKSTSHSHPQRNLAETILRPSVGTPARQASYDHDDVSVPSDEKMDSPYSGDGHAVPMKLQGNGADNRTIVLRGIPDRATHADIVAAIRGGALVDIFFRSRERMASISFAESKAAQEFMAYAKRQLFCILDKPIEVSWSDRPFILSNYIASQISNGASRNILIRGVHLKLTEAQIREDMEHIHNLVIISVTFAQGNAYISTNSVQKASYARNCMRSRMPYKLMRLGYYPDECAEPLPKIQHIPKKEIPQPLRKLNPMANRFEMLHLDESVDDSDGSEDLTSSTSVAGGVNWASAPFAV
ncbi:hypothetical protein PRK78_004559 [Emydomyces testavorans]|uniref:RRM domain-containing protein n=1 Tax=Emydomyces testavorans TaxID=2070801 RepID=A0AAF0DLQ7_9EURO|nr:hypothetical protein PRK78_004559 [Emydomyces testavorans]